MREIRDWITSILALGIIGGCYGHYCYYCATSMDANTRMNLISQRVFTYPMDARQPYCRLPQLLESGSAQMCDKPLCLTLTPAISQQQGNFAYPGNFTILGCAELILRPSMISRIPLDAYTTSGDGKMCIEIEHTAMDRKMKFDVCFCNSNWCNSGGATSETTGTTVMTTRYTTKPAYDIEDDADDDESIEGSGESAEDEKPRELIESLEVDEFSLIDEVSTVAVTKSITEASELDDSTTKTPAVLSAVPRKPSFDRQDPPAQSLIKATTEKSSGDFHKPYWNGNDEKSGASDKLVPRQAGVGENRRQQHTRDLNSGRRRASSFVHLILCIGVGYLLMIILKCW